MQVTLQNGQHHWNTQRINYLEADNNNKNTEITAKNAQITNLQTQIINQTTQIEELNVEKTNAERNLKITQLGLGVLTGVIFGYLISKSTK